MRSPRQRVAVVGVGAIGGALAADLATAGGHEVVLCVRTPFDELVVSHPGGTDRLRPQVLSDPAQLTDIGPPFDWVLVATKAHQTAAARPWLDALCGSGSGAALAVAQNGVDHTERARVWVPASVPICPVVVQLPSEMTGPGRVRQSREGQLVVPDDEPGRAFARLFEGARTRVLPRSDFPAQAWWKLLSNAAIGGVCALAERPNGYMAAPEQRQLALALMREIVEVARAEGAPLPADAPEKVLEGVLAAVPDHWSSISVDRRERRAMEWEVRNAVVGRLGRRHGIATPVNDALTTLLRAVDATT